MRVGETRYSALAGELAVSVALPGWAALARRRVLAIGLLGAGVAVPIAFLAVTVADVVVNGRTWVALSLDQWFLAFVVAVGGLMVAARLVAVGEVWWAHGHRRPGGLVEWAAIGLVVAVCAPVLVGVVAVGRARAALEPAFAGASGVPLFEPAGLGTGVDDGLDVDVDADLGVPGEGVDGDRAASPADGDTGGDVVGDGLDREVGGDVDESAPEAAEPPPLPERPRSGIDPAELADVTTVLLLGADSGPDRQGLRTDTMMLFSLHEPSGRASLVSLPRDTAGLLFPPGTALEARYPYGFTEKANAVYPIVSSRPELRSAYDTVPGVRPGVVATAQAIGYSLDVAIHDYVLVDMQGFLELVDALGGVTVNVPKAVPMPGNVPGARHDYPETIGPGRIHMDGTTALGYVRSRKADSDYQRTGRQRALLAALATQIDVADVALRFPSVAAAVGGTLRTSLTPDELAETLAVIGGETAIVESVGLVPPLVDPDHPDWQEAAQIVGAVHLALVTGRPSGY